MFYDQVKESADYINARVNRKVDVAVILGSGLGKIVDIMENKEIVPYKEIPNFPQSSVAGHAGNLVFGNIGNTSIMALQGRFHYYEGFTMKEVAYPVYVMKIMGIESMIVTNACGGINETFKPGDLMLIDDFINSLDVNPLMGENDERFGLRFPDMSCVYNKELQQVIRSVADRENIELKEGVYLQTTGPNYETPAEIQMYKKLGADAVGMSTAVEAMVANYLQIKVCGISCITNKAAGLSDKELNDEEVKEVASKVAKDFETLLKGII